MGGGSSSRSGVGQNSVDRAVGALSNTYPLNQDGYFGVIGEAGSERVRQITSDDPTATFERFEKELTKGATVDSNVSLTSGKSYLHPDGTRVNIRPNSKSQSPAIDIVSKNPRVANQKIHFEGTTNG